MATAIYQSPEHRGLQVTGYYQSFLGRTPSTAEQAVWVNAFLAGAREADVERAFLLSPEFQGLHTSATDLVASLYTNLLGRVGNAAEYDLLRAQVTRDNQLPVLVFNLNTAGNIMRMSMGENVGTLIN